MIKNVTLPEVKGFESSLDDSVSEQVREALLGSRRHPETVYVSDPTSISEIEKVLVALHGLRGQRTPVLYDPALQRPFEIRWGL